MPPQKPAAKALKSASRPRRETASPESKPASGKPVYNRVLLKLSGEALLGTKTFGIDREFAEYIAGEIKDLHSMGVELAITVGGGNIFRGVSDSASGMDRVTADHMGMLATVINGLAMQDALERQGVFTRVLSAIEMREVAEPYIRRRAIRHMEKKRVVIFAGGTGSPYFSTDTAAALRAAEVHADIILKATKVDGVYDSDPVKNPRAKKFTSISYFDVLRLGLRVMDTTAISMCMENRLPIIVYDLKKKGNLRRIVAGEPIGTIVKE